jgi:hypothetical protein
MGNKHIKPVMEAPRGRTKKVKQPAQKPPMEPVMLMTGSGKKKMTWREWGS